MWLFQKLFPLVCYSLLNFFLLDSVVSNSFDTSFQLSNCHDDERAALLRFKQSFVIDRSVSVYEGAYPKVSSWKLDQGGHSNCCAWDGVECDEKTGHVIGLNLNSSCLFGSMNSNSSLFGLFYLRKLNLADNHFNFSPIPSAIGRFSSLTRLDLSDSRFFGQVPLQISHLSKLTFLDLSSRYDDPSKKWLLELQNPNLRSLIQNLTSLEWLHLESVYVPSTVPEFLANISSLKWLLLANCGLYGWNKNLTGYLPEFHQPSPLTWLSLWDTSFSGNIPPSIGKLDSLQMLYLRRCNFSRQLPSSLSNLTQLIWLDLGENHLGGYIPLFLQNLTRLTSLELDGNQMTGPIPSWLGNLNQLETLSLQDNNLNGYIPSSFQNLSQLSYLSLCANRLIGPIPSWLGNLTRLVHVYLYSNDLHGSIPHSLSKLMNLEQLHVQDNNLSGVVEFDMFFNMRSLVDFLLSNNNLSVLFEQRSMNATTSKFTHLGPNSKLDVEYKYGNFEIS
ncbi:hypothetical protein TIFTF001_025496 [Ficus carica]|uniref:Leucine-rich repeat-containing N-terminal plant-type domain-containing protein n=1 Tax=Ficus carica TaxID=3494 RepID=A0AA88ANU3_FICCA|nr:hypothetical protein TIFTF001_025496 [Ficus carica]